MPEDLLKRKRRQRKKRQIMGRGYRGCRWKKEMSVRDEEKGTEKWQG